MVSCTKLLTTLTLAVSIVASTLEKRASRVVVGYRTVSPKLAQEYQKAGNTLTYKADDSHSSDQLGPGAYISPIRGDWPMTNVNWDCVIYAESSAWNLVNKAWVPETADDGCTSLWYADGEPHRNAYLGNIGGPGFTTSNTVLLSSIDGYPEKLQILIPPSLMGKSGGLDIEVQCAVKTNQQGINQMPSAYIDWYSWVNVKGTPQHVNNPDYGNP